MDGYKSILEIPWLRYLHGRTLARLCSRPYSLLYELQFGAFVLMSINNINSGNRTLASSCESVSHAYSV